MEMDENKKNKKVLKIDICRNCGAAIVSKDGKKWVHGTIGGFSELRLIFSPCEKAEPKYDKTFIIAYESGLGKGWMIIEGTNDTKEALETFKEKEPDIYKLCQYPHGVIHIAEKLEDGDGE